MYKQVILGAFIKFLKWTISLVCPYHGTTPLLLERFSRNFIFEDFSKISRANSSFITT